MKTISSRMTLIRGFTLVELMIVIAIIGILAATAVPAYKDYMLKSIWSVNVASIESVKTAAAQCMIDHQHDGSKCALVSQLNAYGFTGSSFPTPPHALLTPLTVSGAAGSPGKIMITFTGNAKAGGFVYSAECSLDAGGNFACLSVAGDDLPPSSGWTNTGSAGVGNQR